MCLGCLAATPVSAHSMPVACPPVMTTIIVSEVANTPQPHYDGMNVVLAPGEILIIVGFKKNLFRVKMTYLHVIFIFLTP